MYVQGCGEKKIVLRIVSLLIKYEDSKYIINTQTKGSAQRG